MCITFGLLRERWHVLALHRARHDYPELKGHALANAHRWKPEVVLIEAAGTGTALCREMQLDRSLGQCRVMAITPREPKPVRLEAQTDALSRGLILLPADAPWLTDLRHELLGFPNAKHDDQVDALVQFVAWATGQKAQSALETAKYGRRQNMTRR